MTKTAVDSFKGGKNVKYLRAAWIWGFRCCEIGGWDADGPTDDELWEWWNSIAVPEMCSPDDSGSLNNDDNCVIIGKMSNMSLDEKDAKEADGETEIPPVKKKPGRPKKEKKKKAKKAKNPKLSKPLLRALLQDLELVGEDDKSDLKSLQNIYKEHYNSLLDEKGFVDEEKDGEFQILQEKMADAEQQWAEKQGEKKAKKGKKKESDDSSNVSEEEKKYWDSIKEKETG